MLELFAIQPPSKFLPSTSETQRKTGIGNSKREMAVPNRSELVQRFASRYALDSPSWGVGMDKLTYQIEAHLGVVKNLGPAGFAEAMAQVAGENLRMALDDLDGIRRQLLFTVCATAGTQSPLGPPLNGSLELEDERARLAFASALAEAYANVMDLYRKLYEDTLMAWGRKVREPFSNDTLAISLTALVEGLALRVFSDPAVSSAQAVGAMHHATLAILIAGTAAIDDDASMEDLNQTVLGGKG